MKISFLIILATFALKALACDVNLDNFYGQLREASLYENDPYLEPAPANMTEKEFKQIIDKVLKIYTPYFKNRGWDFEIVASWKDPLQNAKAAKEKNKRLLYLSGGYAREKYMSHDAYLTVICHEIGHHLGGFPLKQKWWATTEGQADYYSTLKCMKNILKYDPKNKQIATSLKLPQEIKSLCRSQYKKDDDYYICLRSAKASEDYGKMTQMLDSNGRPKDIVSLLKRDTFRPDWTYEHHPEAQCRVDTKLQGALCNIDERIMMNDLDERQGACHQTKGNILGVRPSCWFISKIK